MPRFIIFLILDAHLCDTVPKDLKEDDWRRRMTTWMDHGRDRLDSFDGQSAHHNQARLHAITNKAQRGSTLIATGHHVIAVPSDPHLNHVLTISGKPLLARDRTNMTL